MMTSDEIEQIIRRQQFVIYGTGFVGKRFYRIVKERKCENNVSFFAITVKDDQPEEIEGKPVCTVDSIRADQFVCVAVQDASYVEIEENLRRRGVNKIAWIFPSLNELEFGKPVLKNQTLDVLAVCRSLNTYYIPAIWFSAIENYHGLNSYGIEYYIRMQSSFSRSETAIKRWKYFEKRINEYEKESKEVITRIKTNKNHCLLIDGTHGLMLANFYGIKYIGADIYTCGWKRYRSIFPKSCYADLKSLFSKEEIKNIMDADSRMRRINNGNVYRAQ